MKGYSSGLRRAIERNKPRNARSRGTVVVGFRVEANGAFSNIHLAQSSGNEGLDQAALSAVSRTGHYQPPPSGQGFNVQLPVKFD